MARPARRDRDPSNVPIVSGVINHPDVAFAIFRAFPNLVSLAACEALDDQGNVTDRVRLMVGRKPSGMQSDASVFGSDVVDFLFSTPHGLDGSFSKSDLAVVVFDEAPPLRQDSRVRPACGGVRVAPQFGSPGTLGCAVRLGHRGGLLLSCRHVIAGESGFESVGNLIYQPGMSGAADEPNRIAKLTRWVPETIVGSNEVDAALGVVDEPQAENLEPGIAMIGALGSVAVAEEGDCVRLVGSVSGEVVGEVYCVGVSLQLSSGHVYVNQIRYTRMTVGGDSGAVLLDAATGEAVGLHFAASDLYSYANRMDIVLKRLGGPIGPIDTPNGPVTFHRETITLAPGPNKGRRRLIDVPAAPLTPSNPPVVHPESTMGCPVINLYVCCGDKGQGAHSGARPLDHPVREGLPRFDRYRFFNGTNGVGSGRGLTGVTYRPKKTGAPDGMQGPPSDLPDRTGVDHINANPTQADMKPDEIYVVFMPNMMPQQKVTLKLTNQQIIDGFYYRRVLFEYRAGNRVFADVIYGQDLPGGFPGPDFVDPEVELVVSPV